ncbi:MAG: OmpP1/FadL family transporter [Flavobacteriales bacterium]
MKRIYILFFGIALANFSIAQNETDALRYSYLNYNGTARFVGLGGAMGALGADMSAININPAGMGRYSRSDFSFTSDLTFANAASNYNGSFSEGSKANFNIPNVGAVFAVPIDFNKASMWRYFQFGVSSSRTNDFHGESFTTGNHDNSMLLSYSNYLNDRNINLDQVSNFYERQAYNSYLLDYDEATEEWSPWYDTANGNIDQANRVRTRGAQYQTDILFSGNYNGNLYIGGSIGFPRIRYNSERTFSEKFNGDTIYDLEDYTFEENITTNGNGINFKAGVIYLPVKSVRLGFAVHSPTWYSMNDQYNTTFTSNFTNDTFDTKSSSPEGSYDYRLKTPGRIIASAAFLFKKRGLISLEYEYVDYAGASLRSAFDVVDPYDFDLENTTVDELYKGAGIIKAGAEFRVTNHWTVRGGYTYFGSPIKDEISTVDRSRTNYSGGLGYKNKSFSLDLTFMRSEWQEENYLYDPALVNKVTIDRSINNFMVTAGFRF